MPLEDSAFPYEAQVAFFIHGIMQNQWDNMNGYYIGKDWCNIEFLCKLYSIDNIPEVLFFLKYYDEQTAEVLNAQIKQMQEKESKKPQINVPKNVQRKV